MSLFLLTRELKINCVKSSISTETKSKWWQDAKTNDYLYVKCWSWGRSTGNMIFKRISQIHIQTNPLILNQAGFLMWRLPKLQTDCKVIAPQRHHAYLTRSLGQLVSWSKLGEEKRILWYFQKMISSMMVMMMIHDEVIFAKTLYIPILWRGQSWSWLCWFLIMMMMLAMTMMEKCKVNAPFDVI